MKIYKTSFWDRDLGHLFKWHSNKRDAERSLAEFRRENGESQGPSGVERVEIPTDVAGLVRWLNSNLNSANG